MKKVRVVERSYGDDSEFVIQQKHFLFRWMWVDAWINSWYGALCQDSYPTLKEAQDNVYRFDGTKCKETVKSI